MGRKKNYKAELESVTNGMEAMDDQLWVELPMNPRRYKTIDHTQYMGLGFDLWAIQALHVIRSLLSSKNFSVSSLIGYSVNGLRNFLLFLRCGAINTPPAIPNSLTKRHLERYISWLKLNYPNGSTAKNYYSSLKSLVISLIEYGFIEAAPDDLLPPNPFPNNSIVTKDADPLSMTEMQRLISALKSDLVSIHKGGFPGNGSEAMTVLLLITAARCGANTTPLLEMPRDTVKPHPFIPNLRLVTTVKRRGKGAQQKTMRQTNLLDAYNAIPLDGVAVLNKAISLSEPLIELAPEEIKPYIWLYRSGQRGRENEIAVLTGSAISVATKSICKRHELKDDHGNPLSVSLSRLRKTMESRLWKLSGGDLIEVASIMGHTPQVADNHYLNINNDLKVEGAIFIDEDFTDQLRGVNITPTPPGGCTDSLYGSLAPKNGVTHCSEFIYCLTCPNFAIAGTFSDLYRLFSYQQFLIAEASYYLSDEWAAWRKRQTEFVELIDKFTAKNFDQELLSMAKSKAQTSPHPFWAKKIAFMEKVKGAAHGI